MLSPRQRAASWRWGFIGLGLVALLLGFFGFVAQSGWTWDRLHVHDALFKTVQLFALAVSAEQLSHPATQLASLLAPAATAGTLWLAFFGRIRRRWRFFRLGWRPADDLFLGCGDTAAAIALHRPPGSRIVGLDPVDDPPLRQALRIAPMPARRMQVFRGDAQSRDYLDAVNAAAARRVWILTGDDLRNLAIARRVLALRARARVPGEAIIVAGLREATLARARHELWRPRPGIARVEYFDLPRLAARRLLLDHPPAYPRLEDPAAALHLCVVGDGDIAPALVVQAALHCVHDDDPARCLRLTWIAPDATARLTALRRRHPALDPANAAATEATEAAHGRPGDPVLAPLLPLAQITALDADPAQITPRQWIALQSGLAFSAVYLAAAHDLSTRSAALRLLAVQDVCAALGHAAARLTACLHESATGARDDPRDPDGLPASIARFVPLAECFAAGETYPGEQRDTLAKIVHLAYRVDDLDAVDAAQRAQAEARWAGESDEFRWSSRAAADHIDVKLALLGLTRDTARLGPGDPGPGPLLAERLAHAPTMQRLMRIEHRRFVAERLLEGWLPLPESGPPPESEPPPEDAPLPAGGPAAPSGLPYDGDAAATQKSRLRLNRTLVAFEALTDAQKEFDRRIIAAMPACLREARRHADRHRRR